MKNKALLLTVVPLFVGFFALAAVCIFLMMQIDSLENKNEQTNNSIELLRRQNIKSGSVAVDPLGERVYIPELKIRLPYNPVTKTLTYSMRDDNYGSAAIEADVSSSLYVYPNRELVKDCGGLVRLKIEDKQMPYNPHEKTTTVNLDDGRKLQVYEFYNENSCNDSWSNSISPKPVADAFLNAESY